jgi:uncharacterized protein YcaQ
MIKISNTNMRALWLRSNGLQSTHTKNIDVLQIIKNLGFVQLDTIQNVTRAHHHILWSRNKNYKEHMIDDLLLEKGNIFEHFTHDASVLPVEFYPMWKGQFTRYKEKLDKSKYYKDMLGKEGKENLINRIKNEGALHTKDFESKTVGQKEMWSRPAHKTTLDYMWYCGVLSTAYRKSFRKYYDLTENIIPNNILNKNIPENERIHWLCTEALHRLSVASGKEIKNFWDTLTIKEVNTWIQYNSNNLIEVQWENNEGKYIKSFAPVDIENRLNDTETTKDQIQIINPFDPAIRDRIRLKKIFDFDYKIEIFVPKKKRVWGYYVYPLLQDNNFIGRIELQANRKENTLNVINFWQEEGTIWNDKKLKKLDIELTSFALLIGIVNVIWVNKL